MVYLPRPKLLYSGNETTAFFPVWRDKDSVNISDVFTRVLEMVERGAVEILIESHNHHILRGAEGAAQMRGLVENWVRYERAIHRLLAAATDGLLLGAAPGVAGRPARRSGAAGRLALLAAHAPEQAARDARPPERRRLPADTLQAAIEVQVT
jgi:hypothetical protein